jgi:hypothetical protein
MNNVSEFIKPFPYIGIFMWLIVLLYYFSRLLYLRYKSNQLTELQANLFVILI